MTLSLDNGWCSVALPLEANFTGSQQVALFNALVPSPTQLLSPGSKHATAQGASQHQICSNCLQRIQNLNQTLHVISLYSFLNTGKLRSLGKKTWKFSPFNFEQSISRSWTVLGTILFEIRLQVKLLRGMQTPFAGACPSGMLCREAELDVSEGLELPPSSDSLQQRYPGGTVHRRWQPLSCS